MTNDELYKKYDAVVLKLTEIDRLEEADYVMVNFFLNYEYPDSSEKFINEWEKELND